MFLCRFSITRCNNVMITRGYHRIIRLVSAILGCPFACTKILMDISKGILVGSNIILLDEVLLFFFFFISHAVIFKHLRTLSHSILFNCRTCSKSRKQLMQVFEYLLMLLTVLLQYSPLLMVGCQVFVCISILSKRKLSSTLVTRVHSCPLSDVSQPRVSSSSSVCFPLYLYTCMHKYPVLTDLSIIYAEVTDD